MNTVVNLSEVNALFGDNASPIDVLNYFYSLPRYSVGHMGHVFINGRLQISYYDPPKLLVVPFIWNQNDTQIKHMKIVRCDYVTIGLIQLEPNDPDPDTLYRNFGSLYSRTIPDYGDVIELITLDYTEAKTKRLRTGLPLPDYAKSGRDVVIALLAIARVFRYKWAYATDASTIDCGIPFLIYRLLAGKNSLQESRGFTQIIGSDQCDTGLDNVRNRLIDDFLPMAPSLGLYRGMTIQTVFGILNNQRFASSVDKCQDVKRLVEYLRDNIFGLDSCGKIDYIKVITPDDFPPRF